MNKPLGPPPSSTRRQREPFIPNSVLAMLIFVVVEIMMFAGFISAFAIAKSSVPVWPPPGQPRLPWETTAFNTLVLLASGIVLYWAGKRFDVEPANARLVLLISMLLGAFFVIFQGTEWALLMIDGLTLRSQQGGFFYLIVGAHALHAIVALIALLWAYVQLLRNRLTGSGLWSVQIFWYFVVGVWPILYWMVYL